MKINDWLDVIDYKVLDGSFFGWKCYGDNAFMLSWQLPFKDYDSVIDYYSTVCFDTKTKGVYYVEIYDENSGIYYGWFNKDFVVEYEDECIRRGVSSLPEEYSKVIKTSELEILEVLKSIYNNQSFYLE